MKLEQKVMASLKEAMKAKDDAGKRALRAIKSAIVLAKTDGSGKELDAAGEIKLVQKLIKQRQDSLSIFNEQGREDLAVKEREEIAVIEKFLPKQMDSAELETFIKDIIAKTGASSMRDMGKVMGMASAQLAGRADGKTVSTMVKQLLS
ncbi:MAG: GatB/YqeY domain-containing protein [Saprospiraceae bacterium]